ncbi:hypothetical protein LSAT2_006119, partial [Lamellibrachia satsuma]
TQTAVQPTPLRDMALSWPLLTGRNSYRSSTLRERCHCQHNRPCRVVDGIWCIDHLTWRFCLDFLVIATHRSIRLRLRRVAYSCCRV